MIEFFLGMLSGGVGWQMISSGSGYLLNRRDARDDKRKEILLQQTGDFKNELHPLLVLAFKYYASSSADGRETSAEIKAKLQVLAINFNALNGLLSAVGRAVIPSHFLISLRKALTYDIDVERSSSLDLNHPSVLAMIKSVEKLSDELEKVRVSVLM